MKSLMNLTKLRIGYDVANEMQLSLKGKFAIRDQQHPSCRELNFLE